MTAQPPTPRRPPWPIPVIVAVAVAAAAGVVAGLTVFPSHHDGATPACRQPVAPLSVATRTPGQDRLVIAEQGYTPSPDGNLSIGGVMVNHTDQAAYCTRTTFRTFTADGISAVPPS